MRRMQKLMARKNVRKRYIRYSLLSLNILLLGGVILFVFQGTHGSQARHSSAGALTVGSTEEVADPLDQLSSADIAVSLARMTDIAEAGEVVSQAISVNTELTATPIDKAVANKPQAVLTTLKSRKDIQSYVAQAGDTVQVVAAKFNVTSDSIKWSNGLSGNTLAAGQKLTIPPVTGIVYTVRAGDTPDSLAQKYRADKNQIIAYNDAEISGLRAGEQIIIPNGQQVSVSNSYGGGLSFLGGMPSYGSNGYDRGWCTWYAANRRAQLGNPVPGNLGNAYTWAQRASGFGIPTGSVPKPGAVAVKHSGNPGHVAIVEVVNEDGSFWISEMNSSGQRSMTDSRPTGGWGVVDWKLIPASSVGTYTYVY